MIYTLIFIIVVSGRPSTEVVDFHTLSACQAASVELKRLIKRTESERGPSVNAPVVLCVAKGEMK
jgi:hypothetical protein